MSFELGGKSVEDLGVAHRVDVAGFTGAASLTIPISTPAGRSSLRPELALVYTLGPRQHVRSGSMMRNGTTSLNLDPERALC